MGNNLKEILGLMSGRGVLGSLYIGTIGFWLLISIPEIAKQTALIPWIQFTCFIIGYIITQITYEMLLPLFGWVGKFFVLKWYNKNVKNSNNKVNNYNELRQIREGILASDIPENLKVRITKDENLRQNLFYLITSSILGFFIVYFSIYLATNEKVRLIELVIIYYILASALIGLVIRSCSFGRTIAIAKNNSID